MSREAMQQALEALEALKWRGLPSFVKDATTALRQALAEPEQEPVAWYFVRDLDKGISFAPDRDPEKPWQPLYTAPTQAIEPVAWMVYTESGASAYVTDSPKDLIGAYRALPLYTAPTPQHDTDCHLQGICQRSGCSITTPRKPDLEALNAELVEALKQTTGAHESGLLMSARGLDKARAALAKAGDSDGS